MNIEFEILNDLRVIKRILNFPGLKEATTGYNKILGDIEPDPATIYISCYVDDKLIGMYPTKRWTNKTLEVHIYIFPSFWGEGVAEEATKGFVKYIRDNTTFDVLYSYAPASSKIGNGFFKKLGCDEVGTIPNALEYFGETTALNLYSMNIRSK